MKSNDRWMSFGLGFAVAIWSRRLLDLPKFARARANGSGKFGRLASQRSLLVMVRIQVFVFSPEFHERILPMCSVVRDSTAYRPGAFRAKPAWFVGDPGRFRFKAALTAR